MTNWQPIETAPSKGRFLLWLQDEGFAVVASYRSLDGDDTLWIWEMDLEASWHNPTHWMQIPPGPEGGDA